MIGLRVAEEQEEEEEEYVVRVVGERIIEEAMNVFVCRSFFCLFLASF